MNRIKLDQHKLAIEWVKVLDVTIKIVALLMVGFHLLNVPFDIFADPMKNSNLHLLFAFVLLFLNVLQKTRKRWLLMILLALLGLVCTLYIHIFFEGLLDRVLFPTPLDVAIGIILILLCLEGTRLAFGFALPIMTGLFILYSFFGHKLPGIFTAIRMRPDEVISRLALGLGVSGIYGSVLAISANYIFLFMVFASLINVTGAVGFFNEIGRIIGRKVRAGPALAATITSALIGSLSGSSGANVMVTGSYTIPAMKKVGYTPEQAGAIEAAASTAGPIIPPIMGTVAFIMAGFTGISYSRIALLCVLPALLYVFSVAFYCYFQGEKMQVERWEEPVNYKELLLRAPLFLIPLLVIVVLFIQGYTPMYVSFWAVVTITILGMIRKKTRPSLTTFIQGISDGAILGSKVGVTCAALGIIVTTVTMTGVGVKFPSAIIALVGDNLILLLLLTGIISIILGMGLPATASYMVVAVTIVPTLTRLGVDLLPAHLFVFFYANFSFITPPVAIAALFAAQLAGGNYMKTAFKSGLIGIAGFLIPLIVIYSPAFVFDFSDPFLAITTLIASPFIFLTLQSSIVGYFLKNLNLLERLFIILSPAAFFLFIYCADFKWFALGVFFLVAFVFWQFIIKRKESWKQIQKI